MTFDEIKQYVLNERKIALERRLKRGMPSYRAESEAYLICLGMAKALYKTGAITDEEFGDLITEI